MADPKLGAAKAWGALKRLAGDLDDALSTAFFGEPEPEPKRWLVTEDGGISHNWFDTREEAVDFIRYTRIEVCLGVPGRRRTFRLFDPKGREADITGM